MKRIFCSVVLLLATMLLLVGCGKFTCDICEEEKSGKQYTEEVLGEEVVICKDCKAELDELEKELEDLGDELGDLFE